MPERKKTLLKNKLRFWRIGFVTLSSIATFLMLLIAFICFLYEVSK